MTTTIRTTADGVFHDLTTADLAKVAVEVLRYGDIVLGDGDQDYAAADMLEVLAVMHDQTGINLELLPQIRAFAITILDGRWTP